MRLVKILDSIVGTFYKVKTNAHTVTEATQVAPYGFASRPLKGVLGVLSRSYARNILLGYVQTVVDDLGVGETIVFSRDSQGELAGTITSRSDDSIEFLGTGEFLIKFSKMEAAFNELKADHNSLVQKYSTHTHPTAPTGPISIPSLIATASTASMSDAKAEKLKTI